LTAIDGSAALDGCWSFAPEVNLLGMAQVELMLERLTHSVVGAFFEVHNSLGYGFLEHLYRAALERELMARGHLSVARFLFPFSTKVKRSAGSD